MKALLLTIISIMITFIVGIYLFGSLEFGQKEVSQETLKMIDTFSVKIDIDTKFLDKNFRLEN